MLQVLVTTPTRVSARSVLFCIICEKFKKEIKNGEKKSPSPFFIFFLNFSQMMQNKTLLALTLVGVVTTRPHSKESRPEIQNSSGGRWGTRHGDDLLFPMLLLSQSDETIAL